MEEKMASALDVIEKLIVDGQKEVMSGILHLQDGQKEILGRVERLEDGQEKIKEAIKTVHSGLKNEIKVTAGALEFKIDEHLKQPAHAGR